MEPQKAFNTLLEMRFFIMPSGGIGLNYSFNTLLEMRRLEGPLHQLEQHLAFNTLLEMLFKDLGYERRIIILPFQYSIRDALRPCLSPQIVRSNVTLSILY